MSRIKWRLEVEGIESRLSPYERLEVYQCRKMRHKEPYRQTRLDRSGLPVDIPIEFDDQGEIDASEELDTKDIFLF